nr:MAG TPA: Major capsid protein [Caudoviricetes sp.]
MVKKWNLQLFADGGEGGSAAGVATSTTAGNGDGGQNAGSSATYTFEQAEEIATARAQRAEAAALKSYFEQHGLSEDEVKRAMEDYKTNKEKNKPNISAVELERDKYKTEFEQLKNTGILRDKGVKPDDLDYVLFKVNQKVTDKLPFDKAAAEFLKENPRFAGQTSYKVTTSTHTGGAGASEDTNDYINNAIRMAARR